MAVNAPTLLMWLDDAVDLIDEGLAADALTPISMARDALREAIEDGEAVEPT